MSWNDFIVIMQVGKNMIGHTLYAGGVYFMWYRVIFSYVHVCAHDMTFWELSL